MAQVSPVRTARALPNRRAHRKKRGAGRTRSPGAPPLYIRALLIRSPHQFAKIRRVRCADHTSRSYRLVLGIGPQSGPLRTLFRAQPAAQQTADLGDHAARVLVLSIAQPAPAVGEAQIDAQPAEGGISAAQGGNPRAALP